MAKKIIFGVLILVVLSASIYVMLPEQVRIDIQKTRTIFKVYDDGKFIPTAYEYTRLFDGRTKMLAKNRIVDYTNGTPTLIHRKAIMFRENITIEDFYYFDGSIDDIEQVPISHKICFTNAKGKLFEYLITDLDNSFKETFEFTSPFSFGEKMKINFHDDYYRAKYYNYLTVNNKIKIRYRIINNSQCFNVRLTDPLDIETISLSMSEKTDITGSKYISFEAPKEDISIYFKDSSTKDIYDLNINEVFSSYSNGRWKFGSTSTKNEWSKRQIILSSELRIEKRKKVYYFREGYGGYFLDDYDICPSFNNVTNEVYPCYYNDYIITDKVADKYYLEITFASFGFIDPSFTFENLEANSTLTSLRFEGDGSTHLNITTEPPYDSLVVYYDFDVDSSPTTEFDYSRFDNDGTYVGSAHIKEDGFFGGVLNLGKGSGATDDGEVGFLRDVETDVTGTRPFAFVFWLYLEQNQSIIGDSRIVELSNDLLIRAQSQANINFLMNDAGGNLNQRITYRNWTHIVAQFNGTMQQLYVNGVNTDNATPAGSTVSTANWKIGDGGGGPLNGSIDDFKMFNISLTHDQIVAIYTNSSPRFVKSGTQEIKEQNGTFGTDNRINVSIDSFQNLLASNISVRVATWNVTNGYNLTDDTIVTYWGLNNESSLGENDTHVFDMSGNGYNGTVDGASVTQTARFNDGFDFVGSAQKITMDPGSLKQNETDGFSLFAWVNLDVVQERRLWDRVGDGAEAACVIKSDRFYCNLRNSTGSVLTVFYLTTTSANKWYHFHLSI